MAYNDSLRSHVDAHLALERLHYVVGLHIFRIYHETTDLIRAALLGLHRICVTGMMRIKVRVIRVRIKVRVGYGSAAFVGDVEEGLVDGANGKAFGGDQSTHSRHGRLEWELEIVEDGHLVCGCGWGGAGGTKQKPSREPWVEG